MGFAIASFKNTAYTGGFWVSEDFSLDGPKPTWTSYVTGLPASNSYGYIDIRTMCVEPTDPTNIQYVQMGDESIYKRDGVGWKLVFTRAMAQALMNEEMPFNPPMAHSLGGITADPGVPGKLYTVYRYHNAEAAWWKSGWYQLWSGGALMASDDYGETWYRHSLILTPRATKSDYHKYVCTRHGMSEVIAQDGHVWTVAATALIYSNPALVKVVKGTMPTGKDAYGSERVAGPHMSPIYGWTSILKVNPHHPWIAYGNGVLDTKNDIFVVDHNALNPTTTPVLWSQRLTTGGIISDWSDHNCSDRWWINPDDETDQRIISVNGLHLGYVYHDTMSAPNIGNPVSAAEERFANDGIPILGGYTVGNLNCRVDDGYTAMYFMAGRGVWGIQGIDQRTPILLGSFSGAQSNYGLYVHSEYSYLKGHPYVFAVELGTTGGDDQAESGRRLPGTDSAYNTIQEADLHGRDIKEKTPTVHNPWPAKFGEAPVSDGDKYVATPVLTVADRIVLFSASNPHGNVYEFSTEGFNEASGDALAGDKIEIMGAGTITGALATAEEVHYYSNDAIIFTGEITTAANTALHDFYMRRTADDSDNLIGVIGPEWGTCRMVHCDVQTKQSGAGNSYAISAERGGVFLVEDCSLEGTSVGGFGYAGRSLRGKIKMIGGRCAGSTDGFYIAD
jgi:hypothetical protein